jgi:preprotein translocase subunit SecA
MTSRPTDQQTSTGHVHGPDCDHDHDHQHHGHVHGPDCDHGHHHPAMMPLTRSGPKVGRNDPCPCGSGKKYKKCCISA